MKAILRCMITAGLMYAMGSQNRVQAEPCYAGEWHKTRLYGHCASRPYDFTDEQYQWIADHCEYFTFEKGQAYKDYGGHPAHEAACRGSANKLVALNPRCKPLMIYSIGGSYTNMFESEALAVVEHPDYFRWNEDGSLGSLNFTNSEENDWYVDTVNYSCDNSALHGIFVDGFSGVWRDARTNCQYMLGGFSGMSLVNGYRLTSNRDSMYDGNDAFNYADAVFCDSWFRRVCDSLTAAETLIDTALEMPDDAMLVCFSANDIDGRWGTDYTFSHAAYLIVANDHTYYRWAGDSDIWSSANLELYYDDYDKEMGPPLAPAIKHGLVYTRRFEHCTVRLDIEQVTSSVTWGENNKLVAQYDGDDGTGAVLKDRSANGFDGAVENGIWEYDALAFNGQDSKVILPAEAFESVSNAFSIAMWVRGGDTQPVPDTLFQAVDSNGERVLNIHLPWSNSRVYWDAGSDGPDDFDRMDVPVSDEVYKNRWTHWVFTKDALTGEMKIYANGELLERSTGHARTLEGITAATIGAAIDGQYFDGAVQGIRIYNYALMDGEVFDLCGLRPKALWDFEEESGSVAADGTGHGYDAAVTNGIWIDGALQCDGSSTRVSLPASAFSNLSTEVTLAAWIYGHDALPVRDSFMEAVNSNGNSVLKVNLPWITDKLYWYAGTDGSATDEIHHLLDASQFKNQWNHWVFIKDVPEMHIYLNGERIATDDQSWQLLDGITEVALGGGVADGFYPGTIGEFRLYEAALTSNEVLRVYAAGAAEYNRYAYDLWTVEHGLSGEGALVDDDSDADGLSNLEEYALGGHPGRDDSVIVMPSAYMWSNRFYFVNNTRTDDPSLNYLYLSSTNLSTGTGWKTNQMTFVGESEEASGIKSVTNQFDASSSAGFFQLKVEN